MLMIKIEMMKKLITYITCGTIFFSVGCKKFLTEEPRDVPSVGTFLNNETEMNYALNAIYRSMEPDVTPTEAFTDVWTDIGVPRAVELGEGNFDTYNTLVKTIWAGNYTSIQEANSMLDGMVRGKDNVLNPQNYNRMEAEARVLRVYAYHRLVFMFGDVPLITKPLQPAEYKTQSRTAKSDVVKFMYDELDKAVAALNYKSDRGRVNKAVALGLKARIALYNKDYGIAAQAAKLVMDEAGLSLNPRFQDLFTRSGQKPNTGGEIMFEVLYSDAYAKAYNWVAYAETSRNANGQSGRFPTQRLVDMFEASDGKRIDESAVYKPATPRLNRDQRLKYTVAMPGDTVTMNLTTLVYDIYSSTFRLRNLDGTWSTKSNQDFSSAFGPAKSGVGYLWMKYAMTDEDNSISRVSFILMRYAEILLTYAEAKIELGLGEMDGSVKDVINLVRKRAGQPPVPIAIQGNQQELRKLIRRERNAELAGEGFRWVDIRRWGIGDLVMPGNIAGIAKSSSLVLPIPNFKLSATHDLNSIPDYTGQLDQRITREVRYWFPRLNLMPIPQSERDIATSLSQNPGW
ncbi:MAG TPA: RagB/SusD family nutrient uptake outer membrane protein [Chitinophaga sp.]|uniref:RagB/SusD family nutrient uptake outer membrane protein n=1 Tax=Chitinophaga sp. TaxID=1869181 RepID=UPI002C81C3F6|nr:RagB/SusD family nutrient uptake outer membrane protein [Chitinophaga sp.]HVI44805.1 RagB/SusD family nutrient uptake outer membrane protein [Chitinophaga sp.]